MLSWLTICQTTQNWPQGGSVVPGAMAAIERQWEVLASLLEEFGPKKTTAQWKTVWRDLKSKARVRLADLNRASKATGNLKVVPPLTKLERKMLAIIGTVCSIGDPSTMAKRRRTDVQELDDAVKIFKIIQEDNNSSYKEIATSVSSVSSSLASNQQLQASNISQLVAVQQEAKRLKSQ
uniref:Regulatory protein zeste n=1 Tax=Timema genevievae TaxID=629358 RepID=A0A7R9K7F2_TIMGE|nr:unnamed protein product [Timema genevievae]